MLKTIRCDDIADDCPFTAVSDSERTLVHLIREHASERHGVELTSSDLDDIAEEKLEELPVR